MLILLVKEGPEPFLKILFQPHATSDQRFQIVEVELAIRKSLDQLGVVPSISDAVYRRRSQLTCITLSSHKKAHSLARTSSFINIRFMSMVGFTVHPATFMIVPPGRVAFSAVSSVLWLPAQSMTTSTPRPSVAFSVSAMTSIPVEAS